MAVSELRSRLDMLEAEDAELESAERVGMLLHARFLTKRVNHSEAYLTGEANTNQAESFFSSLRRAESASITMSPVRTCPPMRGKWHGAKTTAVSAMAINI